MPLKPEFKYSYVLPRLARYLESKEEEEALSELPVVPPSQSQLARKNSKKKDNGKLKREHIPRNDSEY